MKLRQLAASNIRGNWHQYVAFFLSSVFSVMIFFIFAEFIFHPGVVNGTIRAASKVRGGLKACEYIIVIFSFFFVLYSNSAFLKSRKKEFGLLSLFGMTSRQLKKMIMYENTLIAALSIAVGIGFGALFSKLFFMAMTELLKVDNPIPFAFVPEAVGITALSFFLIFQVITLMSLFRVGKTPIIELLRASKKPKSVPVFSGWLVLVSALALGAGYTLAAGMKLQNFQIRVLPILFLTLLGTYFLFTQGSVAILRRLQGAKGLYYKNTRLLAISQLVFRMKDNARLLFIVATLSAVVLTSSGTFYSFYMDQKNQTMEFMPQSIGMTNSGDGANAIDPERVRAIIREDGETVTDEVQLKGAAFGIKLRNFYKQDATALMISESSYNKLPGHEKTVQVDPGHAVFLFQNKQYTKKLFDKGEIVPASVGGKDYSFIIDEQLNQPVVDYSPIMEAFLIIDDARYAEIMQSAPQEAKVTYDGFELKNWTKTQKTADRIYAELTPEARKYIELRVTRYNELSQYNSLTLFIGVFVSILFFVAAGSMIYFKLFTELQEDQAVNRGLSRIGVSGRELVRVASTQIAVIFFVPVLIGGVHAAFAMKALENVTKYNVWLYGGIVFGIYCAMQFLYFAITRRTYVRMIHR